MNNIEYQSQHNLFSCYLIRSVIKKCVTDTFYLNFVLFYVFMQFFVVDLIKRRLYRHGIVRLPRICQIIFVSSDLVIFELGFEKNFFLFFKIF